MIETEELSEIPNSWKWTTLGEISSFKNGINFNKNQKGNHGILAIDVKNMYSNSIKPNLDNLYRVNKKVDEGHILRNGDLLFVRSSVKREGIGWTCLFEEISEPITYVGFIIRARLEKKGIHPRFLAYYFRKSSTREEIIESGSQVTITNITQNSLSKVPIPIPLYNEQIKITLKIDELFSQLDVGFASLKRTEVLLNQYRQAVLKAAMEGELTKEWREKHQHELEPSSVLLERILKERQEKWEAEQLVKFQAKGKIPKDDSWKKKYKELEKIDIEKYHKLPANWIWTQFQNCIQQVIKVQPKDNPEKEFFYLDISSIDNKKLKITQPKKYIGKNAPLRARQLVESEDILFSTVRTYLKNIAMVDEIYNKHIASTGFCVIRPHSNISNKYIFYVIQTSDFLNPLTRIQRGTSYPAVRNSDIYEQIIPLPPYEEQMIIVNELEKKISVIDKMKHDFRINFEKIQIARQCILKSAFEGKLVPQNLEEKTLEETSN